MLGAVGVEVSAGGLGEQAIGFSDAAQAFRSDLVGPLNPVFDAVGVHQRWSLFPIADPEPWWMHVEARREGAPFELLYRPWDEAHDWELDRLEYRRVRGVWNPGSAGTRYDYPRFVDWVARRAFDYDETYVEVRVRMAQYYLPLPTEEDPPERTLSWHFEEVRRRAEMAP